MPDTVVERTAGNVGAIQGLPLVRYAFELEGAEVGWRILALNLREELSEPYECVLDLVNEDLQADVDGLEGATCAVRLERDSLGRRLCGLVWRVEWLGSMIDHLLVRVHVRPALAALGQNRGSRIFQGESVRSVLQQVLGSGLAPYERSLRFDLDREYSPREYCTQYAESDLEFAARLMSEEGIFYFFDHSGDREELVLVDHNKKCPAYQAADGGPVPVTGPDAPQELLRVESIARLGLGRQLGSTGVVLRDFDWTRPRFDLTAPRGGPDGRGRERTVYEHRSPVALSAYDPGRKAYTLDDSGPRARVRNEALQAGTRFASGEGNVIGLAPGMIVEVEEQQPLPTVRKFLVTRVDHEGEVADEVQHHLQRAQATRPRYRNHFSCIPLDLPHRPAPVRRLAVPGPQTATVVGPPGEEVFTDEHGRIKVQFHWDREGARDDRSSCWIRVMQSWAGPGFGSIFLPRIGMEVVVHFLDGEADRPLVMGCVFNGMNPSPLPLPQEKTKTTIKTRSSPGGDGYNELCFEDAVGAEEISIHAQKDLRGQVLADRSYTVGGDDSLQVSGDQRGTVEGDRTLQVGGSAADSIGKDCSVSVGGDESLSVGGRRTRSVARDESVTVVGDRSCKVGGKQSTSVGSLKNETVGAASVESVKLAKMVNVGAAYSLNVGAAMNTIVGAASIEKVGFIKVIDAGTKIQLACGKSKITLDKQGKVTIEGTELAFVSKGPVTMKGDGDVAITGKGPVTVQGDGVVTISGKGPVTMKGDGVVTINGQIIDLNP
jgi:type VI secretion system secreted protein VgrG